MKLLMVLCWALVAPALARAEAAPLSRTIMANGVQLAYLDWGGDRPPLVMIHGIADDPHIFDDLAPHLRSRFRLIAYARRGHGRSAAVPPYDAQTLTEDLHRLLDGLGIRRANLLGWSMGGDEITELAGRYPDRVAKLVYLEAGYDWSDPVFFKAFSQMLEVNSPQPADLRSLDTLRAWNRKVWFPDVRWSAGLEAYLRDMAQPSLGKLDVTPAGPVFEAVFATLGSWKRDYRRVRAPALAIYASSFFPATPKDPQLVEKVRTFERTIMVPFRKRSMDRIGRELPSVTIQQLADCSHMSVGVKRLPELANAIRAFLEK
jgi:pimeloyl-ACP methyl ester carboxylesterase